MKIVGSTIIITSEEMTRVIRGCNENVKKVFEDTPQEDWPDIFASLLEVGAKQLQIQLTDGLHRV